MKRSLLESKQHFSLFSHFYSVFFFFSFINNNESTNDIFCSLIVAEQAESIDNPMHEAAKRGVTSMDRSDIVHLVTLTPTAIRGFGVSGGLTLFFW